MKKLSLASQKGSSAGKERCDRRVKWSSALLLLASVSLSGCAALNIGQSDYSCSGLPEGVQCMSARDVYAATNDGNVPRAMHPKDKRAESEGSTADVALQGSSGDAVIDNYVAPRLPDRPVPIRTPAQVMRIWVAPWEDTNGDLIVSGYIYTEIEPRRWVIGEGVPHSEPVLRPLQTVSPTEAKSNASN